MCTNYTHYLNHTVHTHWRYTLHSHCMGVELLKYHTVEVSHRHHTMIYLDRDIKHWKILWVRYYMMACGSAFTFVFYGYYWLCPSHSASFSCGCLCCLVLLSLKPILSLLWSCFVEFYNSFEVCISIMYDIVIAVVVGNIMGHQEKLSLCLLMHTAIATAA